MAELTKKQRSALLAWAAEGLRLTQINQLAAEFEEPFQATWLQLKHARKRSKARFTEFQAEAEAEAISQGLARKADRIRQLEKLFDGMVQVIAERGQSESMIGVAGGRTGLLVRDFKQHEEVFKFDAALVREMRSILDDIAKEMGQRQNRHEISGPDGGAIPVTISDLLKKVYAEDEDIVEPPGEEVSGSG
jgi:hypothetical protein